MMIKLLMAIVALLLLAPLVSGQTVNHPAIDNEQITAAVSDFSLTVTPGSQTINPGDATSFSITPLAIGTFNQSITVSATTLVRGISLTLSPTIVTAGRRTTLTVSTMASLPRGHYIITITGSAGLLRHSVGVAVNLGIPDFSLTTDKQSQSINTGDSANFLITSQTSSGLTQSISLTATVLPATTNITCSFSPNSITPGSSSTLHIATTAAVIAGSYTITINGLSGTIGHSHTVTVTINQLPPPPPVINWSNVNDFTYQLQNIDLTAIGNSKFDLVIIDYSLDGSDDTKFTLDQINALKNSPGGPKLVLAYLSIGEAEDYRYYWNNSWDANRDGIPDAGAPTWLGPSNPDYPNNYKVRYWQPGWQSIIFGSPNSYLDKVLAAGFDGVYLDIIDAYEYWGPGGESGLNRATAEQEMVDFVKAMANYARVTKARANFGVFPQNGEALSSHPDYLQVVTGIGEEDTWFNDNNPQSPDHTAEVVTNLDRFHQAGKLVLVTDYVTIRTLIDTFYGQAQGRGYVPYATTRDLDRLTINPGHEPD